MTSTPSRLAEMESAPPIHVEQSRAAADTVDYCIILGAQYITRQWMVGAGYFEQASLPKSSTGLITVVSNHDEVRYKVKFS
jgi:hypothetical protein